MLIIVAGLSLLMTLASICVDLAGTRSRLELCRLGMCRSDQLFATIDAQGITPTSLGPLLEQDAGSPLVWSTFAEALERHGQIPAAGLAFEHAISLGPNMAPVLMRAANFAYTHADRSRGWELSRRILQQTDVFDGIVFSYLPAGDKFNPAILGNAIPVDPRAARTWLSWLRSHGSDQAVLQTCSWMSRHELLDRPPQSKQPGRFGSGILLRLHSKYG